MAINCIISQCGTYPRLARLRANKRILNIVTIVMTIDKSLIILNFYRVIGKDRIMTECKSTMIIVADRTIEPCST